MLFIGFLPHIMVITKCSTSITSWPKGVMWVSGGRDRWPWCHWC